uniref:Uncharacterized protein n=1 Tax=Fagus sylvatica TaxID=28930 RepID=A0A2N9EKB4_FAGSY
MKRRHFGRLGDTCRYASGWGVRSALSSTFWRFFEFVWFLFHFAFRVSHIYKNWVNVFGIFLSIFRLFFVGVSRFADNNLGPPPLEGYVSSDSVLHWLAAELYSIVYLAISTWGVVRDLMAANETEWPLPLSNELPKGLSSQKRKPREVSFKASPSTSRPCPVSRVDRSWKAMSYFSKIDQEDINRIRMRYQIPDLDERACCPKFERDVAFYEVDFQADIAIWRRESSKDCLRPTGVGRTGMFLYVVTTGRGYLGRKLVGILPEFVGEIVAAPVSLKRKKVDEGPSKQAEQSSSHPPFHDAVPLVKTVPPVIMVDVDPSLPTDPSEVRDATINQSPHVTMSRAKSVVSSKDMDDYSTTHTKDIHYLLIHSLMRSIADEAEMKNSKRAVTELTRDRNKALIELEKVKSELKARDDDVKVAVEAKAKAVADLQHLVGQIEGAKAAAVSEFRASEAFDDINTCYFLSGFEAFRKQAMERFPDQDFSVFQPYDDEDSVVDGAQDDLVDDEDVTFK